MLYSYQIREIAEKLYSARGGSSVSALDVENYIKYNCPHMTEITSSDVSDVLREYYYLAGKNRSKPSTTESYGSNMWETAGNSTSRNNLYEENLYGEHGTSSCLAKSYLSIRAERNLWEWTKRDYHTCPLQIIVVIFSILICVLLGCGICYPMNYAYMLAMREVLKAFPVVVISEIVLHRVFAKPLYYKWCTELNIWIFVTMFIYYYFFLYIIVSPESFGERLAASGTGIIICFFLVRELPEDIEFDVIYFLVYALFPMFYDLIVIGCVVVIVFLVIACVMTVRFLYNYRHYDEQPRSYFDKRCKSMAAKNRCYKKRKK